MPITKPCIKILYIAGEGRSGSTILGNVLGGIDGFFFVGEAISIWRHFLLDNRLCACGIPARTCPVWRKIFTDAFDKVDAQKMEHCRNNSTRNRFVLEMLKPGSKKRLRMELAEYLHNIGRLYESISRNTGANVIIDSSKKPTYAFLLNLIPNIQVYTLHLIRDSRGVAFSWAKRRLQQEVAGEAVYMHQFSALQSAWRWNSNNFLTELLLNHPQQRFLTMRYEDFIAEPAIGLSQVFRLLDVTQQDFPIHAQKGLHLKTNHAIWGNPCRFQTGYVELHEDIEWKRRLPSSSKYLVTFLTSLGLRRYNYL